jgi:hypothetical protein
MLPNQSLSIGSQEERRFSPLITEDMMFFSKNILLKRWALFQKSVLRLELGTFVFLLLHRITEKNPSAADLSNNL